MYDHSNMTSVWPVTFVGSTKHVLSFKLYLGHIHIDERVYVRWCVAVNWYKDERQGSLMSDPWFSGMVVLGGGKSLLLGHVYCFISKGMLSLWSQDSHWPSQSSSLNHSLMYDVYRALSTNNRYNWMVFSSPTQLFNYTVFLFSVCISECSWTDCPNTKIHLS